jgi:hypothetical protein
MRMHSSNLEMKSVSGARSADREEILEMDDASDSNADSDLISLDGDEEDD